MLNYEEARGLFDDFLKESRYYDEMKIHDEASMELEYGWVFFYNLVGYSRGNYLIGNSPCIVNKFTGELYHLGTGERVECRIDDYEAKINGRKNVWTIRLKNKPGIGKLYRACLLSRRTHFFFYQIWEMLGSFPASFEEGGIRKILPIKCAFEEAGVETVMEKKAYGDE